MLQNDKELRDATANLLHQQQAEHEASRDSRHRAELAERIALESNPALKASMAEQRAYLQAEHRKYHAWVEEGRQARRRAATLETAKKLLGIETKAYSAPAPAWDEGEARRAQALIRAWERQQLERVNLLRQARRVGLALLACAPPSVSPPGSLSEMLDDLRG